MMVRRLFAVAALLVGSCAFALAAPPPAGPITTPNVELPVLITNAAVAASTVSSAQQTNLYARGLVCTFNMSAHTGTPSTTVVIQGFDPVSNSYYTLGTSGAITADATPTSIMVYPAIQTASLPTNMTGFGTHLPKRWRVQNVVAGTTPVVTSTTGCVTLN